MPFPDEDFARNGVTVVEYRAEWLMRVLRCRRGSCVRVQMQSPPTTSVPGLPAKDSIDLMVRVQSLADSDLSSLVVAGYRERPEEWNRVELLGAEAHPKRVYAPPVGGRSVNIHVREGHRATARYALLFRDFFRANDAHRDSWGQFKVRLAEECPDLYVYGQMKATVQPLLMALAEQWAAETAWRP